MMKKALIIVLNCLLCGCIIQYDTDEWPVFMHDLQHTGYSSSDMPRSLCLLWEYEENGPHVTRLIISGGNVIVARVPHFVYSLDFVDGSLQWKNGKDGLFLGFPAAHNNKIYIGLFGGILCLDGKTGNRLWKYEEFLADIESPPIVINKHLFVGSGSGSPHIIDVLGKNDPYEKERRLLCLDAETGELVWEFQGKGTIFDSPCYYNGYVFISDGYSTYCLDAEGGVVWEKEIEGASFLSLLHKKRLFVVSYGGHVNCLNYETGALLWQYDCGDIITNALAVGYNKVFFGSENMFYCVDANRGTLCWKREIGQQFCSPVLADKKVAQGAENVLYILDVTSGEPVETYEIDTVIESIALSDGKLVIGGGNGRILCLGSSQEDFSYQVAVCIIFVLIITAYMIYMRRRTE